MKRLIKYTGLALGSLILTLGFRSCEKFLNPEQDIAITEDQLYSDWYEYRSVEMGLYALQQDLVEQLLVLGELRGDLLDITDNADADLVEVYNFSISKENKYASPIGLFKLISASNNFISILEKEHPEVLDPTSAVNNYDRLYGEALCMRAWAYFNAVRIYGKVPFIPQSLTTIEEIEAYVESPGTYIDSVYINFSKDGYYNDTLYNEPIVLEKHYYDLDLVIDVFTNELENKVKAVGVNHYIDNSDDSWEITIWNSWAMHALLGQMYLSQGDLIQADQHFEEIMYNTSEDYRYHIDDAFANDLWTNIFTNIDNREHIFTIWFDNTYLQQNEFQNFFEPWTPNSYMLKPSYQAIFNWETVWRYQQMNTPSKPEDAEMEVVGMPTDIFRGYGSSYLYVKNGSVLSSEDYSNMIILRMLGDDRNSRVIMEGVDTIVYKYSLGKESYDGDANYLLYRAAGIHFYMAEIWIYLKKLNEGLIRTDTDVALGILNDGSNYDDNANRVEVGIRGRVGLGDAADQIPLNNIIYEHDPFTNEIIGYTDYEGDFEAKQEYLEEQLLNEKSREMAFEGERYYDIMRIAKRRNDPSFLAEKISAKYPASKRDEIYNYLLNENNWYIHYFD